MKKFIIALTAVLIPAAAQSNWSENQRKEYMETLFPHVMEHERYADVLDVPETVVLLKCVGTYYEKNYEYEQFIDIYYNGSDTAIEEFSQVEDLCINAVIDNRNSKYY